MVPPEPRRSADARRAADGLPTLTEVLDWRSQAAGLVATLPVLHTEAAASSTPPSADALAAGVAGTLDEPDEPLISGPGAAPGPAAARLHPLEPGLEAAIHRAVDAAVVRLLTEIKPQLAAALHAAVLQALVQAQAAAPGPSAPTVADGAGDVV